MVGSIKLCGLGPDAPDMLTLMVADALLDGRQVVLRTGRHGVADWLNGQEVKFQALDDLYESADSFDALNEAVVRHVIDKTHMGDVVYAVPGQGLQDATVQAVLYTAKERGIAVEILPGLPDAGVAQAGAAMMGMPVTDGVQSIPAAFLRHREIHTHTTLIVDELDGPIVAGEAKLQLLEVYPQTHCVYFYRQGQARAVSLVDLDRQEGYGRDACVVIPAIALTGHERFDMSRLVEIISILRAPDGCPWDREQTHLSLRADLIEEAYEVLEAIDLNDPDLLCEELGDLLLQVVLHAQIAQDTDEFTIEDVISGVSRKMIFRHRHIFGDVVADTPDEVIASWETLKQEEKGFSTLRETLMGVSRHLPALMRARKVLKRAELHGQPKAQWETLMTDITKHLEWARACKPEEKTGMIGRLLMHLVALSRLMDVDAELALKEAVDSFIDGVSTSL